MTSSMRDNVALGSAGLAEGTNANTFKTSNILHYVINGRAYVKAATDNIAFSAGHTAQAAKEIAAYFVLIDTSGTVTTQQSSIKDNSQTNDYIAGAWDWPFVEDKCCIGAIVVDAQNAATFTAAATDLGAADVVDTYHNVALNYGQPVTY